MEEINYSSLSKSHRRKLKEEQRSQKRKLKEEQRKKVIEQRKRKERIKKIRNYSITILAIITIFTFFYWKSIPPKNAPIIELTPSSYNFGSVSQTKGVTSTEMTISNKGNKPLILNNMDTSCGCTSASVIYRGVESPKFSMAMHGTNPKNWKQVILPGESAQLKIYYDPNVHKTMRGSVTRSVYIYSNDPRNSKEEVKISLVQVN